MKKIAIFVRIEWIIEPERPANLTFAFWIEMSLMYVRHIQTTSTIFPLTSSTNVVQAPTVHLYAHLHAPIAPDKSYLTIGAIFFSE